MDYIEYQAERMMEQRQRELAEQERIEAEAAAKRRAKEEAHLRAVEMMSIEQLADFIFGEKQSDPKLQVLALAAGRPECVERHIVQDVLVNVAAGATGSRRKAIDKLWARFTEVCGSSGDLDDLIDHARQRSIKYRGGL